MSRSKASRTREAFQVLFDAVVALETVAGLLVGGVDLDAFDHKVDLVGSAVAVKVWRQKRKKATVSFGTVTDDGEVGETDVFVDGVDALDVARHGLDAGLLALHVPVEQVVGLQVQHARDLPRVDGRASPFGGGGGAATLRRRRHCWWRRRRRRRRRRGGVAAQPTRVQRPVDGFVAPPATRLAWLLGVGVVARPFQLVEVELVRGAGAVGRGLVPVRVQHVRRLERRGFDDVTDRDAEVAEVDGTDLVDDARKGDVDVRPKVARRRFDVVRLGRRGDGGVQVAVDRQDGAHRRPVVVCNTHTHTHIETMAFPYRESLSIVRVSIPRNWPS